jgi:hypothetical protein
MAELPTRADPLRAVLPRLFMILRAFGSWADMVLAGQRKPLDRRPGCMLHSLGRAAGMPGRAGVVNSGRLAAAWARPAPTGFLLVGGREPGAELGATGMVELHSAAGPPSA